MKSTKLKADPFVHLLESELVKRKATNPRYSFRAFAHSLKIDAGTLHHLMSQRRRTGVRRKRQLLMALGMNPEAIEQFLQQTLSDELKESARD